MGINFNPNRNKNDSLTQEEIVERANSYKGNDKEELVKKAYKTGGVSESLSKAAAWWLANDPDSDNCEEINEVAGSWLRKNQRGE